VKFERRDNLLFTTINVYHGENLSIFCNSEEQIINLNNVSFIYTYSEGIKFKSLDKDSNATIRLPDKINNVSLLNVLFDYLQPKKIKSRDILNL
jgi:hypothetical protein